MNTYLVAGESYQKFAQQLRQIKGPAVLLRNDIDDTAPPSNFRFIDEYVFSKGTSRLGKEFQSGCDCRPDNGRHMGCEYLSCHCLEDGAKNENGKPLGFAYYATNEQKGCLRELFLNSRHAIYECNDLCNCPPNCKNKIVQKGRQIPLEIFKTEKRGWGMLYTNSSLCYVDLTLLRPAIPSKDTERPVYRYLSWRSDYRY